jgi:hypothetical protein
LIEIETADGGLMEGILEVLVRIIDEFVIITV